MHVIAFYNRKKNVLIQAITRFNGGIYMYAVLRAHISRMKYNHEFRNHKQGTTHKLQVCLRPLVKRKLQSCKQDFSKSYTGHKPQ